MADDDEIDILGDFSFNSCLAQNNQGIPSCSSREDTVHPQWLLDSTATNWYDNDRDKRHKLGPARKLSGNTTMNRHHRVRHSSWNQAERDLLHKEMAKYGRNVFKISQTIKSKSAAEIQALIEAEFGVNLETPSFGLVKNEEQDDVPNVVQEEIVTDDSSINNVLSLVTTASPTVTIPNKHPSGQKHNYIKSKIILKSDAEKVKLKANSPEIFYDDDLIIGSTESVGSSIGSINVMARNKAKQLKEKVKAVKKIGNHRRKVPRNFDKGRAGTSSKELLKSPQERRRKDCSISEDSAQSPKLQIVLGSGLALPLSEGEQVIKIEKKKDSESDSDIEIDIDSDNEGANKKENSKIEPECTTSNTHVPEAPTAVPLTKFEPMPKRQKKINLDGGGGYTIAHTAAGDLLRVGSEPRRRRAPRAAPVPLMHCLMYNTERPVGLAQAAIASLTTLGPRRLFEQAPYSVRLHTSALILMDAHAHSSRAEVMGLLGGALLPAERGAAPVVQLGAYRPARAAAGATHCDMDPGELMDAHAHSSRAEVMGLLGGALLPAERGAAPVVQLGAYRPARAAAGATHCDMDPGELMDAHAHSSRAEVMGLLGGALLPAERGAAPVVQLGAYRPARAAAGATHCDMDPGELMDAHAHSSRAEVMGLLGGALLPAERGAAPVVQLGAYRPARAAAGATHCDMDPVSQAAAGAWLRARGLRVLGWHHSHPRFAPRPSALDLRSQLALQRALTPCLALITSQHWPAGRAASQYRCFRVEEDGDGEPTGYQLRVRLQPDVSAPALLRELRELLRAAPRMERDVCPQAKLTYLEKCISSVRQHLLSAGYAADDPVATELVQGLRDIFR